MKKLKLFISLWFTMFSMVVFGQAEYEKIAITANTQDNSALKVSVQSSSNEINWKYIKDFQKEKEYLSTGLIKSGVISINGDNTKYNVSAGIGIITNFDDPENPTSTIVNFPAVVAKTPSYLTTSNITYVAINSSGTVTESATPFTPEQRRTLIILGAVIHSNLTNINVVNNISAPTNASTNQLHDLMEAIGALNLSGNKFGPNNANLLMNKSAGTIFKLGSNFVNDWKNPHVLGQAALTGLTFRYRTQNGTEGADVTSINPNVYDLNNVLTAVPSNRYSIQTITLFQSGLVRVQYGQETYGSLSEAEAAISTRSYAVESNIALNGITRAYLLVKEGSTSLTNVANAKFVDAGKFGSITSGGGAITLASIIAALGYTPENDANKQNSLATDGSGVKYPTVDAVNTKVSNIDNTSDLNKPISTATQTALNLKENTANKNIANGYAGLGSDGKLISSQLPSITITDTFVVGSQSAMLSLVAETGDVAVRTDINKSFILQGDTPSDLADWQELLTPTSTVSSVFGRTGAVTANSGDYTADQISETASRKFQTLAQQTYNDATSSIQTQLNGKVSLTGTETIAGAKTFSSTPSFDSNIYLKKLGSWANPANYSVIGGMTNGFVLSSGTNKHAYLDLLPLTQPQQFTFPDKSGTFAMTSDVPTISGTTNYISKFTGTSTLGNSQIFDNGTNVGIGNATPARKLDVFGTSRISATVPIHEFFSTGSGDVWGSIKAEASTGTGGQLVLSAKRNGNTDIARVRITENGNTLFYPPNFSPVVIGGQGAAYYGSNITLASDTGSTQGANRIWSRYDGTGRAGLTFETATNTQAYQSDPTSLTYTEYMRISGNGNVGIGTPSPNRKLEINTTSNGIPLRLQTDGSNTGIEFLGASNVYNFFVGKQYNAGNAFEITPSTTVGGTTFSTPAFIVNSSGNVGIGTTSPENGWKFDVAGIATMGGTAGNGRLYVSSANTTNGVTYIQARNLSVATPLSYLASSHTFDSNVTAPGFFQSSDLRLKDIISRDGDVIKYKWKDKRDDKIHIGYVAQEVQKENPDQVNADDKGILSVNYIEILVQKIKDLEKEIELLKAK